MSQVTRESILALVAKELADKSYQSISDAEVHYSEETGEISFGCLGRQVVVCIAVADTVNHYDPRLTNV